MSEWFGRGAATVRQPLCFSGPRLRRANSLVTRREGRGRPATPGRHVGGNPRVSGKASAVQRSGAVPTLVGHSGAKVGVDDGALRSRRGANAGRGREGRDGAGGGPRDGVSKA